MLMNIGVNREHAGKNTGMSPCWTLNIKQDTCNLWSSSIVTFCVSRRPRQMYCGHARLCVCVSVINMSGIMLMNIGVNREHAGKNTGMSPCWTLNIKQDTCNLSSIVTFCVSRRPRKMYCSHARLCVCVSVCLSSAVRPHYCTDRDVTWRHGRGCP